MFSGRAGPVATRECSDSVVEGFLVGKFFHDFLTLIEWENSPP